MRCEACGHCVDLKTAHRRFWCRKLGMHVFPRNNGYGLERHPDNYDCHWFYVEVTDEAPRPKKTEGTKTGA